MKGPAELYVPAGPFLFIDIRPIILFFIKFTSRKSGKNH